MNTKQNHAAESLALSVVNDGATYKRRQDVIRAWADKKWPDDFCMLQFFDICARESRKAIYEGQTFTPDDKWAAANIVHAYMLEHYRESNNGADWS